MAKTIKIGVIGAGMISNFHMGGYRECPGAEVVAVCDVMADRAKTAAEKFDIPKTFTSVGRMLAMKEIDAVSVCTPNIDHMRSTLKALAAGKHVLCEKPIAMNARQAQTMIDAAGKARKKLMIALNNRFRSDTQFLKKIIEAGKIGKPYYARSLSIRRRGVPSWGVFGQKKLQGGGPLIDIGVHMIDMTWYLMGCPRPVSVSGKTYETIGATPGHVGQFGRWDHKTYDVEDFAVALVRFADGATMSIESSFCVNLDRDVFGCHIVGDKGGVGIDPLRVQLEMGGHLMDCTPIHIPENRMYNEEIAAFVDAVAGNKPVPVPATEAIWTTQIIDAIYASSKANKEIRLK
ncbi:MAG: Gfo/Idh/MocA family oxidoreductase [Planctomycetota bacterium]|nr:Gfo/Idh/MocA family oxidoreductase [Planctomycetota bacterium]